MFERTYLVTEADTPEEFRHRKLSVVVSRVNRLDRWFLVCAGVNPIPIRATAETYARQGREVQVLGATDQTGRLVRVEDHYTPPREDAFLPDGKILTQNELDVIADEVLRIADLNT